MEMLKEKLDTLVKENDVFKRKLEDQNAIIEELRRDNDWLNEELKRVKSRENLAKFEMSRLENKLKESQDENKKLKDENKKLKDENKKLKNQIESLMQLNSTSNAMQNVLDFHHINYHEPKV